MTNQREEYRPEHFRNFAISILIVIAVVIFFSFMSLCSCSFHVEDQMVITKKYAGRVQYSYYIGNFTQVVTDKTALKVCGIVEIPDSVHCYIRIVPVYVDVHSEIAARLQRKYFCFGDKEYRIKTW